MKNDDTYMIYILNDDQQVKTHDDPSLTSLKQTLSQFLLELSYRYVKGS